MTITSGDENVSTESEVTNVPNFEASCLHSIRRHSLKSCMCKFGLNKIIITIIIIIFEEDS
jgi:hypothetical protein